MADEFPKFELIAPLLCDDRRREDNGKELLIGVYSGAIVFTRLPSSFQCIVWLYLKALESGKLPIQFRVIAPSGKQLFFGKTEAQLFATEDTGSIAFPRMGMIIENEGWHVFQWQLPGQDWTEIFRKRILLESSAKEEAAKIAASSA